MKPQVPEFSEHVFREKRNKYCLLIPLLNEGERYFSQARKMKELGIFDKVDVIICDAGSTDGTTDLQWLVEMGHRALLTRHGKGRQSTDMRMGYWWALQQGYEGFCSVDGNDKDDTSAVDQLIEKLDEGYDYIQCSRFMKGGRAINTPTNRFIALRFLNEPVVSIAARKHLSDTSNGFRAFSKKFLLDDRVQPFRDIFYGYELCWYLPVRACQLGFKTIEVPATRAYPASGEIPTKISAVRGKLYILSVLWHIFCNHYNPGNEDKLK